MDLRITGARAFYLLAADCKDAARRDLERELSKGLRESVKPTTTAIKAAAGRQMPSSGGYAGVLVPALRVTPKARGALGISLTVSAKGKAELRDVAALDAGKLRHPVYGRRKQRWAITSIPPGFATSTFEREADAIVDRLGDAMQAVANKIAGG